MSMSNASEEDATIFYSAEAAADETRSGDTRGSLSADSCSSARSSLYDLRNHQPLASADIVKPPKPQTNRWIRVVAFGVAVTFTSCLYAGWQQYSLMLGAGRKYEWLCDGLAPGVDPDPDPSHASLLLPIAACDAQRRAIARLFTLAAGFELFGAVVAGFCLDRFGPKLTASVGSVSGFFSVIMLIISRENFDLMPASMILTGVAINLIAFPALILEDYFEKAGATTASFVVCCQCLSSIIAPLLWLIWKHNPSLSFQSIWGGYLAIVWVPASVFYLWVLPSKREASQSAADILREERRKSEMPVMEERAPRRSTLREVAREWTSFLTSSRFVAMNAIGVVLMLQVAYYQIVVRPVSGDAVADFMGWTMPLQAIWGMLLGRVVDWTKTPVMILALLLAESAVYLLMPIANPSGRPPGTAPPGTVVGGLAPSAKMRGYVSATLFNFAMSYAFTVKYSYVQEIFPKKFAGSLIGVSGAIGGVSVLLTNVLVETRTPEFWILFLAISSFVVAPLALYLIARDYKDFAALKGVPKTALKDILLQEENFMQEQRNDGRIQPGLKASTFGPAPNASEIISCDTNDHIRGVNEKNSMLQTRVEEKNAEENIVEGSQHPVSQHEQMTGTQPSPIKIAKAFLQMSSLKFTKQDPQSNSQSPTQSVGVKHSACP